jgi:hypothetical protein
MTRAELRTEVFRRLQESATTPVFWTVTDVDAALDEAYNAISDATGWCETWVTVDLLHLRPAYDLRTLTSKTPLSIGKAFNDQTNRWLQPTSVRDLDSGNRRWEATTGEAARVWARGLWWLSYYPKADTDSGTVTQYLTVLPDAMTADTDVPGFPDTLHYGLVEYAVSDLWAQDAEVNKALQSWQEYLTYEGGLTAFMQGRAAVPLEHGFHG